jgi:DNA-binding NarL/FixJ family response regulator
VKAVVVWTGIHCGYFSRMARVLVVDDHEIFLQGLVLLLGRDERLEVVGTATNGADAVRLAEELRPDVVLLDVVMPGMDGYAAAEAMRGRVPDTAIVLVSGVDEAEASRRATEVGAAAFVTKAEAVERLPEIIVAVAGR